MVVSHSSMSQAWQQEVIIIVTWAGMAAGAGSCAITPLAARTKYTEKWKWGDPFKHSNTHSY